MKYFLEIFHLIDITGDDYFDREQNETVGRWKERTTADLAALAADDGGKVRVELIDLTE